MAHIFMTKDAKYVKVSESPKAWTGGYTFRVDEVDDVNQASVFGFNGEGWLGRTQMDFKHLLNKLENDNVKVIAKWEIVRKVTLVPWLSE